jgi:membrane protein DedA with SNARE-associated domain
MSSVPTGQFIVLNAAGALVWAVTVGIGGYLFGEALEIIFGNIKHYELEVLGVIVIIGVLVWTLHFYRRKRRRTPPVLPSSV